MSLVTTDNSLSNASADVNIITPVGTYEQNVVVGEGVANGELYVYAVQLILDDGSFDGEVNVVFSVDGDANYCSFFAYDLPRVVFDPSADVTNAEFISVRCVDFSECNVVQITVGESNVLYPNSSEVNVPVPEGVVSIFATVVDAYGNEGGSSLSTFVDRTPPTMEGPSFTGVLDGFVLTFSANDGEGSGVAGYSIRVGDVYSCYTAGGDSNCALNPDAPFGAYSVILPPLDAGSYPVTVSVYDVAGNVAEGNTMLTVIDPETFAAIEGPFFDGNVGEKNWFVSPVVVSYYPISDVYCTLDGASLTESIFSVEDEGNHVFTCSSGEHNVLFYIPIDYTPPSLPTELNYYFSPELHVDVNVSDGVSGVSAVLVCIDGNCVDSGYVFPLPSDGNHVISLIARDVAGNLADQNYIISVDTNSFILDVNVPLPATEVSVSVSWYTSPLYRGDFVVSLDGNNTLCDNSPCVLTVPSGIHTVCIAIPEYSNISRCVEFNVDLQPPSVFLSVPSLSRTTSVAVSWSATDDLRVVSTELSVDGSSEFVPSTGLKVISLPRGTHSICVSAKDLASRTAKKCADVTVLPPHRSRPAPPPAPPAPEPVFPRDDIDEVFEELLDSAHIKYSEVELVSEQNGSGYIRNHSRVAVIAEKEFNVSLMPAYSEWVVRVYDVDGRRITFVERHVRVVRRVYEYFNGDVNIYSPFLVSVQHGSTLAEFRPEDDKYYYIVFGNEVGVPLSLGATYVRRVVQEARVHESMGRSGVEEVDHEYVAKDEQGKSGITTYAVMGSVNQRILFAGILIIIGIFAFLLIRAFR